jgi:hypothetical protein
VGILREILDKVGDQWIKIRVFGAQNHGFPHEHVFVGVDDEVMLADFRPVIRAHTEESPIAEPQAHEEEAISIESNPCMSTPTGGIKYISRDVPGVRSVLQADESRERPGGVVEEDDHRIRTATALEATGVQAVRIDSSSSVDPMWN